MEEINIDDENFNGMECIIKFILILDNSSKRIYTIYYTDEYKTLESQLDFELRLSKITTKYSVEKNEVDIFNYEKYNIICKIEKEIAIFIGQDEDDNEILLQEFFSMFETQLFNFIGENLSREKILNNYKEIVMLIDEMVIGGVILNIDEHSLYDRIKNSDKKEKKEQSKGGGLISGFFGYFPGKSSNNQTPSEQKKEEQESNNILGGLMSSARGYLRKNIEYWHSFKIKSIFIKLIYISKVFNKII